MRKDPPEIYPEIENDFDFNEEKKIAAWTAKWFIMQGANEENTLKTLNLSKADFEKWKDVEE